MKIAFLFLVYDRIENERLWVEDFFGPSDTNKYSIYIHKKPELTSRIEYLKDKTLSYCVDTKWADISLLIAQNLLLSEALKDIENERFIFLSQSCVPVKTLDFIHDSIFSKKKSLFNERPKAFTPRYNQIQDTLKDNKIHKASQWCILTKKHASLLASEKTFFNKHWMDIFAQVFAPDEIAYLTILNMMGLSKELEITNDKCYATTFTNWGPHPQGEGATGYVMPEYKYDRPNINRVKDYSQITKNEIDDIIKSDSFFARKFQKNCVVLPNKEKLENYLKKHLTSADNHL